jgi:hypothetical protein
MAIATMIGATPKQLEAAKTKAIDLCRLAYAPQPVAQPDGTTLALCWSGRIARAYDKLAIARIAKDAPSIRKIETALAQLQATATAAFEAAETAKRAWVAMATAAGQTADVNEVYQPTCTCAACTADAAYRSHHEFRHVYTAVLYDLLAPDPVRTPPIIELMRNLRDKPGTDRLWTMLKCISDAGEAYIKACRDAGVQPNWRVALYPGEGWEASNNGPGADTARPVGE